MNYQNQFKIQQLRTKNLVKGIESLSAFVAAVIANMLIPQLLIRYVYDPSTLVTPPPIFEYLPLVTYELAVLYFIYAMAGNFVRERKARIMERELVLHDGCGHDENCACNDDQISDKELKELEKIVDEALKPKKKAAKRKIAKKSSTKKASKKKK